MKTFRWLYNVHFDGLVPVYIYILEQVLKGSFFSFRHFSLNPFLFSLNSQSLVFLKGKGKHGTTRIPHDHLDSIFIFNLSP